MKLTLPSTDAVFNADEWIEAQPPGTPRPTAYDRLLRARERALVAPVGSRTGVYVVLPPRADPATYRPDRLVAASKMMPGCPLAYHSALDALGLAHSAGLGDIVVLCSKPSHPRRLGDWTVRPSLPPASLQAKSAVRFGVVKLQRQTGEALTTNPARTLVDCLDRLELGGGFEEVVRSLDNFPSVDFDEVLAYLDLLDNATAVAKTGFALEQHAERLYFTDDVRKRFQRRLPQSPVYLRRESPTRLVRQWQLLVPGRLMPEEWEE